jgi:hypothetical protein
MIIFFREGENRLLRKKPKIIRPGLPMRERYKEKAKKIKIQ